MFTISILVVVTLIECDNILLVPQEKWESFIHRPRRFELGMDIEYGFPRLICSLRPVDISSSVAHITKLIPVSFANCNMAMIKIVFFNPLFIFLNNMKSGCLGWLP